jgi:hypothetical protein
MMAQPATAAPQGGLHGRDTAAGKLARIVSRLARLRCL